MLSLITNEIIPKSLLTVECVFCELKGINYEVTLHQCFCMSNISLYTTMLKWWLISHS